MSTLVLGCETGHRFDVNKRGYVSLLASTSKLIGDSAAMLDARERVLESGVYSPIVDALVDLARPSAPRSAQPLAQPPAQPLRQPARPLAQSPTHMSEPDPRPRVLDAGCGTGYYLRGLLGAVGGRGLAMDLSPAAVARAVRVQDPGARHVDGLVADTWRPLPIRDGAADILLNVFAPRNIAEFHRVLAADGILLVVVPTAEHLAELRASSRPSDSGRMLDVPADKAEHLAEAVAPHFALERRYSVSFVMHVDDASADQLVKMGPSAHHTSADAASPLQESEAARENAATFRNVTASVDILRFRRREV